MNVKANTYPALPAPAPIRPSSQLDYASFGFREHISVLHPANSRGPDARRRGIIAFGRADPTALHGWREWTTSIDEDAIISAEQALRVNGGRDLFISQQAFDRRRGVANLTALGSCYVDLDFYKLDHWAGVPATTVTMAVLQHLEDVQLPLPSYILSTGRGLACVWLLELTPFRALPRWHAVQKALYNGLIEFKADAQALDAARVLRLAGSRHSRATGDDIVRMIWCQGTPMQPTRYQFASLAEEVLPLSHDALKQVREARKATVPVKGPQAKPTQKLSGATFWATVFEDLQKLRWYRNSEDGTLPPGKRDAWIFLAANALSWMNVRDAFEAQLWHIAMQATPWTDAELNSSIQAVVKRARLAAAGETMVFDGRQVDCRYRFKADTIIQWLEITPQEQRAANLRVLNDESRRRECEAERAMKSRQKNGATSRAEQQKLRHDIGLRAIDLKLTMNMSREDLSSHFGQSTGYISKAMREARKHKHV